MGDVNETRYLMTVKKGDRTVSLDESALKAWILPSFFAGIGLTLLALRTFMNLEQLQMPGILALVAARTSWLISETRFKRALHGREEIFPKLRVLAACVFLPIAHWILKDGQVGLFGIFFLVLGSSRILCWAAEVIFDLQPPSGAERLPELPPPTGVERTRMQERESQSGFAVLVLGLILTVAVIAYAIISS